MVTKNARVTFSLASVLAIVGTLLIASPAAAAVVPGTHYCLATSIHGGKQGVVCVDHFLSTSGTMQTRGQGLCQDVNTGAIEQCAGIDLRVHIQYLFEGIWYSSGTTETICGRYTDPWHDPPCPSPPTRLQNYSPGVALSCGRLYRAVARLEVRLPVSGTQTLQWIDNDYRYNPSGC